MTTDLPEAADAGDRLATLKALGLKVAQTIDAGVSSRDLSPLVRQMQQILRQIEEIEHPELAPPKRQPGRPRSTTRWDGM